MATVGVKGLTVEWTLPVTVDIWPTTILWGIETI